MRLARPHRRQRNNAACHLLAPWVYLISALAVTAQSHANTDTGTVERTHKYSAICAVGNGENRFIKEWVQYHLCLGIDVIHIFDHESEPRMDTELTSYIAQGQVTYEWFQGHHTRFSKGYSSSLDRFKRTAQGYAYNTCLGTYSSQHTFIGFLDIDEFLVITDPLAKNINAILQDYKEFGGVSFHWRTLGSSGHETRPQLGVVDAYTSCLPKGHHVHRQIKSFVNTRFHPIMTSPHRADFGRGAEVLDFHATDHDVAVEEHHEDAGHHGGPFLVDEGFIPLKRGWNKARWSRVAVYHYVTKSREDFKVKMQRGGGAGITRNMDYFDRLNQVANATCSGAQQTRQRFCDQPG